MTARDDIRLLPSAALTVAAIALVAFVVQHHRAAMWAVVVALVLAVGGLFTLVKESIDLSTELADERGHSAEVEADLIDANLRIASLIEMTADVTPIPLVSFASLSKAEREHIAPGLSVVPPQRDGEHDRLAMSAEEWAAIERETREL